MRHCDRNFELHDAELQQLDAADSDHPGVTTDADTDTHTDVSRVNHAYAHTAARADDDGVAAAAAATTAASSGTRNVPID